MTPGMLELGFNINAGPLSQISVQVLSIEKAVQLAVGAYGWWKARERTESFLTLLSSSGCHLVTSPSFNLETYAHNRQNHHVRGAIVQNGDLQVLDLPRASTGVPAGQASGGIACLRALISALLCLYSVDATIQILAEIIPTYLIQLDQEDKEVSVSGPLLSSLKASIQAVAVEEDANTFRAWLLNTAQQQEQILFGSAGPTKIVQQLPQNSADTALAIGMLKWALTPTYRRDLKAYVTKSLTVWVLAVLLKAVGVEVHASLNLLKEDQDTEYMSQPPEDSDPGDQVMLTVSWYGRTDPYFNMYTPELNECHLKPQLMPIKMVPYAAFKNLRQHEDVDGFEYICSAFLYVYRAIRNMKADIKVKTGFVSLSYVTTRSVHSKILTSFQQQMINVWSPHLLACPAISDAIAEFLPNGGSMKGTSEQELLTAYDNYRYGKQDKPATETLYLPFAMLQALALAVVYGIMSHFLRYDSEPASELSEVAFSAQILHRGQLQQIINALSQLINTREGMDHRHLSTYIEQTILGQYQGRSVSNLVIGIQANGMNAIADLAVRPSLTPTALTIHHICPGQILDLPLDEQGHVVLNTKSYARTKLLLSAMPLAASLEPFEDEQIRHGYRVDLEPFWEVDPRMAVFRLRKQGVELALLNSNSIRHHFTVDRNIACTCGRRQPKMDIATNMQWRQIRLTDIIPNGPGIFNSSTVRRLIQEVESEGRVIVDARNCEPLQLAVVGMLGCRELVLVQDCVPCAVNALSEPVKHKDSVAIVLTR